MCYEKYGQLCGQKGYDVLEKSSDQEALLSLEIDTAFMLTLSA